MASCWYALLTIGNLPVSLLFQYGDSACERLPAVGDQRGGVAAAVDVGALVTDESVVGAVPMLVDVGAVVHEVATAVVDPYLEFQYSLANGIEGVVGRFVGSEDIGQIDGVAEIEDGD